MTQLTCDHAEVLISGLLDGELTQQQQQQVYVHLAQCEGCRQQFAQLQDISQAMRGQSSLSNDALLASVYRRDKPSRWSIASGFVLVAAALLALITYAVVEFSRDAGVPWGLKILSLVMTIGVLLLFFGVARQRFIAAKTDKYKKVNL